MKNRVLALAFAVVALAGTDAFASRARLLVFGTGDGGIGLLDGSGNGGSFYADDAYNMFYNPSYIVDTKDWATIEHFNGNGTANNTAEGGFMMSMAGFHFGAFMNRTTNESIAVGLDTTADRVSAADVTFQYANATDMRPVEFFFGSDMGVKWGLDFSIANFKHRQDVGRTDLSQEKVTDSDMNLTVGAQVMNFEPFAKFKLSGTQKASTTVGAATTSKDIKFNDMTFGTKYKMGEWTPYAAVRMMKATQEGVGEAKTQIWGLGMGRKMKAGDSSHVMYNVGYFNRNDKGFGTTTSMIPFNIAAEVDATSWLALRTGVGFWLLNQKDASNAATVSQTDTGANLSSAFLGASVKMGGASMDWVLGNSGSGVNTEAVALNTQTYGISGGFMSALSLTYNW